VGIDNCKNILGEEKYKEIDNEIEKKNFAEG
jgi:hypothetical protein